MKIQEEVRPWGDTEYLRSKTLKLRQVKNADSVVERPRPFLLLVNAVTLQTWFQTHTPPQVINTDDRKTQVQSYPACNRWYSATPNYFSSTTIAASGSQVHDFHLATQLEGVCVSFHSHRVYRNRQMLADVTVDFQHSIHLYILK